MFILEGYFLQNRTIFYFVDKLSPVSNMAYSCSSDMNKPCWKLVKACPQSKKLLETGESLSTK